jgi:septal ring factor EnvC (AmiA/AmiB activator)
MLHFGGGALSFDVYAAGAKEVLQNKHQIEAIQSITKTADKELKSWQKEVKKISEQVVEMNKKYDLTHEEINTLFTQADKQLAGHQEKLINLRFQAKNLVSQEEWEAIHTSVEQNQ